MGKSTKDKRDIYYRQGKSEGYRARSAYKLIHLNEQYGFLGGAEEYALDISSSSASSTPLNATFTSSHKSFPTPIRVVDLCAAPGSWSQVLSRRLVSVPGSHLVAVDLQAMAPLAGVTQIIGDITTRATADAVSMALSDGPSTSSSAGIANARGKARAQLIVCDGAPDVTGLHDLDEYLQSQLLLAATQITFRLLEVGGTFIAKIFTQHPQAGLGASLGNMDLKGARPVTSGALLADQLRTFFDRVDIAKPRSSRLGSVEHFLVCLGFKPPQNLPAGIIGSLADQEDATNSDKTEDEARHNLVQYAQKLKSQLPRPALAHGVAQSQKELSATLPFVAHGDLSGFDQ